MNLPSTPVSPASKTQAAAPVRKTQHAQQAQAAVQPHASQPPVSSVQISAQAQKLLAQESDAPVDMEKVQKIKSQIESGEYVPDSKNIASKMLSDAARLYKQNSK